jgi:hypothetical protein
MRAWMSVVKMGEGNGQGIFGGELADRLCMEIKDDSSPLILRPRQITTPSLR